MKALYVPLYRMAVSCTVSFGRRWSVLEHLLLVELGSKRSSVDELAKDANMPVRLVIEALINLLQANWIEVLATGEKVLFTATTAGRYRAAEDALPVNLKRRTKWTSLCVDRLTGAWFLADELDLVYERDLPGDAQRFEPLRYTYDQNDPNIRELLRLEADESLEPIPFTFSTPSRPYARVVVGPEGIQGGLPRYAPLSLVKILVARAGAAAKRLVSEIEQSSTPDIGHLRDTLAHDDVIVGGDAHLDLLRTCLQSAGSHFILHSCFVSPATIELILPDLEQAARRKVRVELLWGLHTDPEDPDSRKPISNSEKTLDQLGPTLRSRVQLSPMSSGSHAKIIVFDDANNNRTWTSVIGSCNFLSSQFDSIEVSIRSRSQRLAALILGHMLSAQIPPSNSWSSMARRLDRTWDVIRKRAIGVAEFGTHRMTILVDQDHYACVTTARDEAEKDIVLGCDLYGAAAETSVLVPMERAAQLNKKVRLYFQRPSKRLLEEGRSPNIEELASRGLSVQAVPELHGKFLAWDDCAIGVTSFNWLSTVTEGTRARGAELGILVEAPGVRAILADKLAFITGGALDARALP
jgi:hypothetical protein